MSIQAISYVLQTSKTKLWDRLVLISLANHANDRLQTWPAVQTISHEAGMHERTVQRSLRRLEDRGEIQPVGRWSRGGRRATTYYMAGFAAALRVVGGPTAAPPQENVRFRPENVGKRQDEGQKTPNTPAARHPTPGKAATPPPAARHPTPGNIATPGVAHTPPLECIPDTPGVAARHPSPGKAATLSVIEPSSNHPLKHPAPGRASQNARSGASKESTPAPAEPPAREIEPPPTEEDRSNLREFFSHMARVAQGKEMPRWVGPDYTPEENSGGE